MPSLQAGYETFLVSRPPEKMTNAEIIEHHKKDIPVPMVEFTVQIGG